jgi:hypothetical protein
LLQPTSTYFYFYKKGFLNPKQWGLGLSNLKYYADSFWFLYELPMEKTINTLTNKTELWNTGNVTISLMILSL